MDTSPEAEYRRLIHRLEEARTHAERIRLAKEINELRVGHHITSPADDKKLEKIITVMPINPFTDKEWEEIINNIYKNGDYGFGDEHGPNAWNQKSRKLRINQTIYKKRGLIGKLKGVFGRNG